MPVRHFAAMCALLALAACSDAGRIDAPLAGRLAWFAFIGGEDIKADCRPGGPARYRFVYNAVDVEQVRSYDLARTAGGADLLVRVPQGGLSLFQFESGPDRQRRVLSTLDLPSYLAIARQLEADGFGGPADTSQNFPSWDFYWIVTACAEGRFHINAWRRGAPGFAALRFPDLLFAQDRTGVPVNPVRPNPYGDYRTRIGQSGNDVSFDIRLTSGGLAQTARPF